MISKGPSICYTSLHLGRLVFQYLVDTQTLSLTLKSTSQRCLLACLAYCSQLRAMLAFTYSYNQYRQSISALASVLLSRSFRVLADTSDSQSNDVRGSQPFLLEFQNCYLGSRDSHVTSTCLATQSLPLGFCHLICHLISKLTNLI